MSFTPRLYLDPCDFEALATEKIFPIPTATAHYLGNVLRLRPSDQVIFFNERDGEWHCEISQITKNKGTITAQKQLRQPIILCGPTLVFAPLKRDATDLAVRMATELGVQTIQPVKTLRTNTIKIKEERLRTITIEAAEQSNRLTIPQIRSLQSLFDFCETWPKNKTLWVAIERCVDYQIPIDKAQEYRRDDGILIGPEGGFDPNEIKNLLLYDFVRPLSLGSLVLKAETAIVAGLSRFTEQICA
ncbi:MULTISPECIES: RsmE family RNA methyltransferase [Commensalibacter]|uniref:Ribosomal RNA small subunit methyltransferase E n=2 Tax=Commensalibacter TaxID=1079922 RepID=W7E4D2_9PROT|nr:MULTISPECIES: RsmE family RNA methyltransferase [Commensalibacter]EUK17941.1 16S ribosomal RNA methyltransferase RsmE [Commensalibacter papalotli (ex Servin-Garciduenas et al. 2014)]CAI3941394.1 16S rRNA U1498 N3-methylase RsmE (RsmE) (PDB:1NXZ) [Commensalibacter papalotli (ex Botero et al. 2024)]CAI3949583.1 16S rRNA U1498 N3-methylase RsmE (RsmE) (PDB:1NXZ) [Commensalibacter papalotli (ex Botero et al. 2024)]